MLRRFNITVDYNQKYTWAERNVISGSGENATEAYLKTRMESA